MGKHWTEERDLRLMALIGNGFSIRGAARKMGIPESAAIARHNRIRGHQFPCDREREAAALARAKEKRLAREKFEAATLAAAKRRIATGVPRNQAIRIARRSGARLQAIASAFNLTPSRIMQIVQLS
jgi:hypothetical protein